MRKSCRRRPNNNTKARKFLRRSSSGKTKRRLASLFGKRTRSKNYTTSGDGGTVEERKALVAMLTLVRGQLNACRSGAEDAHTKEMESIMHENKSLKTNVQQLEGQVYTMHEAVQRYNILSGEINALRDEYDVCIDERLELGDQMRALVEDHNELHAAYEMMEKQLKDLEFVPPPLIASAAG
jgi:chromosome segregation ATPase